MSAAVGDVLNEGRFGIYVSNISEEGVLVQGNNLWMPQAGTSGAGIRITTTWPRRWASTWAAGASAHSSAI
jgi:hypothetical protein